MVRLNVGNDEAASAVGGTKMKPESKPPERGSQGLAKADWATVWLPGIPSKTKVTMEPLVTLTDEGVKASAGVPRPSEPTWICAHAVRDKAAHVTEHALPWCPAPQP